MNWPPHLSVNNTRICYQNLLRNMISSILSSNRLVAVRTSDIACSSSRQRPTTRVSITSGRRFSAGFLSSKIHINISNSTMRSHAVAARAAQSVSERMAECKKNNRTAFIPFLVAGDPSLDETVEAIKALDALGADVIELGVPYSDPLADGPVIQAAATRALQQGVVLDKVIDVVRRVSPEITAPIVMFTYFNPIMARGLNTFCEQIKAAGASGLLVPDIPLEETTEIREVASSHGLDLVLLATPTTPTPRMKAIADKTMGFVYLVSVTGVTGMRGATESRVEGLIDQLRQGTDKSIAVGFGVSGPEQAKQIKDWGADGVIVGSALVKALGEQGLAHMTQLAKSIRDAI